jgi:hypothetical protein
MKYYTYLLIVALLSSSFVYGDKKNTFVEQTNSQYHRVSFGPDIFYTATRTKYKSYNTEARFTSNTVFGGLKVGYDYIRPQSFYFGMDGLAAIGKGSYTAYYEHYMFDFFYPQVMEQKVETIPLFTNIEQRYGYTFQSAFTEKSTLIPFAGIGGYYFRDQFNKGSFFQSWCYATIGLRINQQFSKHFDIGCNLKVMYDFIGEIRTDRMFERGRNNIWGYEVDIPCTLHLGTSKKWDLQFQPYLLTLDIRSTPQFFGLRLQTGYSF